MILIKLHRKLSRGGLEFYQLDHFLWDDRSGHIFSMETAIKTKDMVNPQARRRIVFLPAKGNPPLQAKSSVPPVPGRSPEVTDGKKTTDSLGFGLFNPTIATKYLTWNSMQRVGPGFFNDGVKIKRFHPF